MKRLFPLLISLIIMMCTAAAIAAPVDYEGISLEKIAPYTVGKWCDESGHHWVDLTSDRINGVRISNAENIEINGSDGSADLIIADISGDWTLKVTWHNGDDGRYITLDGLKLVPMKNQAPVCETIGGIYLDMSQDALKRVYGQGNILSDEQVYDMCGVNCDGWYYPNDKLIITIDYRTSTVDRIIMLQGSDKFLDNSMLNVSSPLDKYPGIYGFDKVPAAGDVFDLGYGEKLSFADYPRSIMLTL